MLFRSAFADILCNDASKLDDLLSDDAAKGGNYFCVPKNDISYGYLATVFGTVGTVLIGHSNQLIGQIFSIFNSGLMVFVSIFVGYSVFMTVIKTSQEGGFGGGGGKGGGLDGLVILRVCFGLSILTPMFTGYSLIQIWVMWSVLHGVGLADTIWATAMEYLEKHNFASIYHPMNAQKALPATSSALNAESTSQATSYDNQMKVIESYPIVHDPLEASSFFDLALCVANFSYMQGYEGGGFYKGAACGTTSGSNVYGCVGTKQQPTLCGRVTGSEPDDTGIYSKLSEDAFSQMLTMADSYLAFRSAANRGVFDSKYSVIPTCDSDSNLSPSTSEACIEKIMQDPVNQQDTGFYQPYGQTLRSAAATMSDQLALKKVANSVKEKKYADTYSSRVKYGWLSAGGYFKQLAGHLWTTDTGQKNPLPPINSNPFIILYLADSDKHFNPPWGVSDTHLGQFRTGVLAEAKQLTTDAYNASHQKAVDSSAAGGYGETGGTYKDIVTFNLITIGSNDPGSGIRTGAMLDGNFKLDTIKTNIATMMTNFISYFIGLRFDGTCSLSGTSTGAYHRIVPSCLQTVSFPGKTVSYIGIYGALNARDNGYLFPPIANLSMVGTKGLEVAATFFNGLLTDIVSQIKQVFKQVYAPAMFMTVAVTALMAGLINVGFGAGSAALAGGVQDLGNSLNSIFSFMFQIDQQIILMYVPIGTALASIIFFVSMIMSVYFPLIPILLFIFSGIGWMISVVEAMVAGPIVAIGMTHPEGHDLMGKAEQSMMLLFSVFIKPPVIIIAYIISIIMMFIAMELVDDSFIHVLVDITQQLVRNPNATPLGNQMVLGGVGLIYFYVVWKVIEQVFSLIYVVPDKILRWIGGPPDPSQVGGMLDQVSKGAGDKASEAAGGASQAAGKISGGNVQMQGSAAKVGAQEEGSASQDKKD